MRERTLAIACDALKGASLAIELTEYLEARQGPWIALGESPRLDEATSDATTSRATLPVSASDSAIASCHRIAGQEGLPGMERRSFFQQKAVGSRPMACPERREGRRSRARPELPTSHERTFPMIRALKTLATCLLAAIAGVASSPLAAAQTPYPTTSQFSITRAEREVLVFHNDLLQGPTEAQPYFNTFARFDSATPAHTHLGPVYNRVHVVRGTSATRARLVSKLREITSQPTTKAVDLIFITHELGKSYVAFADQRAHIMTVRSDLKDGLTYEQRSKLRLVYSTNSWGSINAIHWLDAGFKTTCCPLQICADTATSYEPFLRAWASGFALDTAISRANDADPLLLRDNAAKVLLRSYNYSTMANLLFAWTEVDSTLRPFEYNADAVRLTIHRMIHFR